MKVCHWPLGLNGECEVVMKKIPIRATIHKIAFHIETNTYAVAVSNKVRRTIEKREELPPDPDAPPPPSRLQLEKVIDQIREGRTARGRA